jgi:hypothetical protein
MSFNNLLLLSASVPKFKSNKDDDENTPKDFTSFIMGKL